jgi:hypothetical protein
MPDNNRDKQADIPTDTDELASNAPASKRADSKKTEEDEELVDYHPEPNPPHTTTGRFFTAPKFGSAGSGGLENEPGPEKD